MKYDVPKQSDHALINREIDRCLVGGPMRSAVGSVAAKAASMYASRAPGSLSRAASSKVTVKKVLRGAPRAVGVVDVTHPGALPVEFGNRRNGGRGQHILRGVGEAVTL
ncbi:hypothetical protein [Corynebacterium parakroppenstedtii]|uniref:hypothetical protein n=1 Tax=Corynebacterium parakroppenstedtii TaxID=2828363 RepID=UPI001C8F0F9E|nr:hypothetical protein [Corynebacterium parakroppenstedtii]MBY0797872.1 hypothetical protein [Corynebacterium parakroppenstedtii]